MFTIDEQFGHIVDYEKIRKEIRKVYDEIYPEFDMMGAVETAIEIAQRDPSVATTIGASALSYSVLVAGGEDEMAANLKDNIFTLGWTEEHTGTDLLSIHTTATPMSDDPDEREYHIKGSKWIINCGYHAQYHIALAKTNPEDDGPRSVSYFLIPRSSTKNHKRLETHVMQNMVIAEFEIDGPGTLIGKRGHGLQILQKMALPSKYLCTYLGVSMLYRSIPAALDHLSTKVIFGDHPINYNNVFRQMYDVALKAAFYDFNFHRNVTFSDNGFLQVHGTYLKSWLLLRMHEVLDQNLLVTGSKGFTKASTVGLDAQDSALLPVFDGHYTLNTLISSKHMQRYLEATDKISAEERIQTLRDKQYLRQKRNEIETPAKVVRKPPFFDYVDYMNQFNIPFNIDPNDIIGTVKSIMDEIKDRNLSGDAEYKYKTGDMLHWMESILAACEMWKLYGDDYANAIAIQYNGFVNTVNTVISEGGMTTEFLTPVRMKALPDNIDNRQAFLLDLVNLREKLQRPVLTF